MGTVPNDLQGIAQRALELVPEGAVIGLGTGRAATAFLRALAERVRQGFRVLGVATSQESGELACQLGIPLTSFEQVEHLDVDVDGADEVDPGLNLIKGHGGALIREKIVASCARKLVILVGEEKLVPKLGAHGFLPVEVVPFGLIPSSRRLAALGCLPQPRMSGGKLFVSDNGNHILDCRIGPIARPEELDRSLQAIPGVVGTGLFLGMADTVLIQRGDTVEVRQRGA
jgi:ribose 5-phosphate isomerase A